MTLEDLDSEWETLSQVTRAKALVEHSSYTHLEMAMLIWGDERGKSARGVISKLVGAYQKCCPELLSAWELGEVSTNWVMETSKLEESKQKRSLTRKLSRERTTRGGYGRPSVQKVRKTLERITPNTAYRRGARAALEYVLGSSPKIEKEQADD